MNLLTRLRRHATVWASLGEIRKLTLDRYSLEELVDRVFGFCDGFFAPIQIRDEIIEVLRELERFRPRYIVEVGTAGGGTAILWSPVADPNATIVTIDLPGGEFRGGSSYLRVPLFRRISLPTQRLHIVRADSHNPETLEITKRYLNGSPADFLFIDADHTEYGVRSD